MKNNRGMVLVLMVPVTFLFFALFLLLIRSGQLSYQALKSQVVADAALLSSLRLRVDGLNKVATRWKASGHYLERGNETSAFINSANWTPFEKETARLKRALSGYKGRLTGVIKVVGDANGVSREKIQVKEGVELGIDPMPLEIRDESGMRKIVPAVWYKRSWSSDEFRPSVFQVGNTRAMGTVVWDMEAPSHGNGGYPSQWKEALVGSRIDPFRYPIFRALLKNEE